MFPWSFTSLTSLHHQLFFKPIRTFAVNINCYLDLISTNYMCYCPHFQSMIVWYSGEWTASCLQNIPSGNGSRAEGENDEMGIPNYRE